MSVVAFNVGGLYFRNTQAPMPQNAQAGNGWTTESTIDSVFFDGCSLR